MDANALVIDVIRDTYLEETRSKSGGHVCCGDVDVDGGRRAG